MPEQELGGGGQGRCRQPGLDEGTSADRDRGLGGGSGEDAAPLVGAHLEAGPEEPHQSRVVQGEQFTQAVGGRPGVHEAEESVPPPGDDAARLRGQGLEGQHATDLHVDPEHAEEQSQGLGVLAAVAQIQVPGDVSRDGTLDLVHPGELTAVERPVHVLEFQAVRTVRDGRGDEGAAGFGVPVRGRELLGELRPVEEDAFRMAGDQFTVVGVGHVLGHERPEVCGEVEQPVLVSQGGHGFPG
ncbi:hypothetical protein ACFFX0_14065 [Citricoccus parietis]|uniref:Uncharacterized protein n=1 Tax=Citricoccus parietis TaxID=592307 RepID=A0ABV5G038_9MICC